MDDDDDDDMLGYCARVCRKPTLSYDVTLENATAIIASEKRFSILGFVIW